MPRKQAEYLDALLSGEYKTEAERCAFVGVEVRQGRRWRENSRFKAEWERRANEKMTSTERVQRMVDVLYKAGEAGDVGAAREYLKYVERFLPQRRVVQSDTELSSLSDAELEAEIAGLMSNELDSTDWGPEAALSASNEVSGITHLGGVGSPADGLTAPLESS